MVNAANDGLQDLDPQIEKLRVLRVVVITRYLHGSLEHLLFVPFIDQVHLERLDERCRAFLLHFVVPVHQ